MRITNLRLFSLTLLATALNMQSAAAKPSAMARRDSPGFRVLPDELEYEFKKRQATTVNPAPAPPASTPAASPPSQPSPVESPSEPSSVQSPPNQGLPSEPVITPPSSPSPPVVVPPTPEPSSSSSPPPVPEPEPTTSVSQSVAPPSSSSSEQTVPPSSSESTASSSSSTPPDTSSSTPPSSSNPPSSTTSVSDSSSSDPATSTGDSTTGGSTTGGSTSTGSLPTVTDGSTTSGSGSTGSVTESGTESPTETLAFPETTSDSTSSSVPTTMSTVSYSLSYGYATVTVSGEESISITTASISQGYVPAAGPAPIAAPLVVQEAPPDPPPNPVCSIDYLPNDVWTTSGSGTSPPPNNGNGHGNGTQTHVPPVSQCNNGTRVSNRVGSAIHLKFYGTEVSLLMVPGMQGGDFDVKIDDEEPVTLSNYKPGVSDCQVASAWNRTGLPNKPHDVTVIVKGSTAGAAGGSNVEFNGLIFKGPQTSSSSGPNIGLIVGATVGGVVLFAALAALIVVIVRKRRARQAHEVTSDNGPASLASPSFRPQTVMSAHSGHTRADSSFSASGYNPSHQSWQNTAGIGAGAAAGGGMGAYGPVLGHTRQTSDAPLMGMVQGQHSPWQPGSPVMNNGAHIPPGAASPMMGSPHSRPMNMNSGYNNGQDRYSFAPSHHRTTSYGSDGRNPFE